MPEIREHPLSVDRHCMHVARDVVNQPLTSPRPSAPPTRLDHVRE